MPRRSTRTGSATGTDRSTLALLLLLALASAVTAAGRPPDVVLIAADDLGYGDSGCYGAKDVCTPNPDRMAREGARFTNFCTAQAVCTALRAARLSGC